MGIQASNLNEQIIKDLLNKNYGIQIIGAEKINRGTANIFKVESNDKVYILKEFSEGRTEESVIKETNIINFLKKKGINVPVYIKSKQNSFYIKFENRIIILQEYIDGYTMENNTGDYKKTIESGNIRQNDTSIERLRWFRRKRNNRKMVFKRKLGEGNNKNGGFNK